MYKKVKKKEDRVRETLPIQIFGHFFLIPLETHLVDVPPVLAAVVEALPHHPHDLGESHHIESQVSDLRH